MQNGSLGEARVRAFLLERFWVSTRSVDVHGADFLIQTRDLSRRFTDLLPPRLGVVQAKFSQDEKTAHHIPRNYLYDGETTISEFFLILALGAEDKGKLYLISAQELTQFPLSRNGDKETHRVVPGPHLAKYEVKNISTALDAIEQSSSATKRGRQRTFP